MRKTPTTCAGVAASASATAARTASRKRASSASRRRSFRSRPLREHGRRGRGSRRVIAMITFKALAALLAYPEAELLAAVPEIGAAIDREGLLARRERAAVASFLA